MMLPKNKLPWRGAILRLFVFLSLLLLTSCGTVISVDNLVIQFPTRSADTPAPNPSPTVTATASSIPTPGAMTALTLTNLNLRSGPSTSYTVIRVIPANSTVQLNGRIADGSWLRTPEGWIASQFVRVSGDIQSLPVIVPEPTPTREVRNRISYNINGEAIPDRAYLTGHLQRLCPSSILVMNNLSYAVELYNLLHERCGTIIISRSWSSLEGDEWFYRSAQSFVAQWQREGHPEIVRYSTNEPSFGGNKTVAQFVTAEIELMRLARASGFTVAMGNFSVGYFQPEQINSGGFDNYLRALNQYGHYLAVHEYACCALPFGVGQWQVESLLDRTRVQPASWPIAAALPVLLWNEQLPPYWYLRRADWFLLRADYLGIARPEILVTEFGWDNLPDIKSRIEPLRQQFGIGRYLNDMRGVNTYSNLWRWYWPQWNFAQSACEQLKWADSIYPDDYIGFNLFTWSINPHWLQTDFSGRENPAMFELHSCLENYHSQN